MKNWAILSTIILLLAAGIYAFVYFFVIPETAAQLIPYKWRAVYTGQKKDNYEDYLGKSVNGDSLWQAKGDQWVLRNGDYTFFLNVGYNTDTVGKTLSLEYQFNNYLFYKEGILKSVK